MSIFSQSAEWLHERRPLASRNEQLFCLFSLLESHNFFMESFSRVSEGPSPLKETQIVKKIFLLPHQAVGLGAPETINRCHRGHYKALSRCRLVGSCVLAKISFRRPTTTVCTLHTVAGNLVVNRVVITIRSMKYTNKFHFFFIFSKLFFIYNYCFLYHGDQKISWWRICR